MLPLHGVLGDIVPGNLTSATLSSHVPHDYLQIIGLPLDMPTYQHSNNRPNIHYCVHPMRYSIQTCHDLVFLIPLNPMINDPEWVKINILYIATHGQIQIQREQCCSFEADFQSMLMIALCSITWLCQRSSIRRKLKCMKQGSSWAYAAWMHVEW